MLRLIAVGDVHGMSDALRRLLFQVDPQKGDEFVFLGDYINRGPDSKGVIDQVIQLAGCCVVHPLLGNHEEMLLAATTGRAEYAYWMKFGGGETLRSYGLPVPPLLSGPTAPFDVRTLPAEHVRFLGGLLDFHETEGFVFAHAGCDQGLPLTGQGSGALRWVAAPDGHEHASGKVTVVGHSPRSYAQRTGKLWRVDTGAGVWPAGKLSAVDVLSGNVWSVPAGLSAG